MKNSSRFHAALFVALGGLLCGVVAVDTTPCAADTIYSNLGAGDSFVISSGALIGGSGANTDNSAAAVPFTNASTSLVTLVEVGVFSFEGHDTKIAIHEDDSGKPGSVLGSVDQTITEIIAALVEVDFSSLGLTLTGGNSYWVSLSYPGATINSPDSGGWSENNQSVTGYSVSDDAGATWSALVPMTNYAVRINGTPVPEPTLGVVGLGLTALVLWRRKVMRS